MDVTSYAEQQANTIFFVNRSHIPVKANITVSNIMYDIYTLKSQPYGVHLTVGGDVDDPGSLALSLLDTKMF